MSNPKIDIANVKRVEAHVQVATALLDTVENSMKKLTRELVKSPKDIDRNSKTISELLDISIKYSNQYAEITGLKDFVANALEKSEKLKKGTEISPVEVLLGSNPAVFEATFEGLCNKIGVEVPKSIFNQNKKKKQ